MIDCSHLLIAVTSKTDLLPRRGSNTYNAGIRDNDKGHIRYAHPSSIHPVLLLTNPISDGSGNYILPGFYELALSIERDMLILTQRGEQIAKFPVFKLEEDKNEVEKQPMDNKSLKKFEKEKRKKEKETKKMIKQGKMLEEPQEYNHASIEYEQEGEYYLIKYERGRIKAWGAIKQ